MLGRTGLVLAFAATLSLAQNQSSYFITRTGSPPTHNQKLASREEEYLKHRCGDVLPDLWSDYLLNADYGLTGASLPAEVKVDILTRFNVTGYNVTHLLNNASTHPRISIAVSGGGYSSNVAPLLRESLVLGVQDGKLTVAAELADYISGLSGGGWLVGSLMLHDMPTLFDLVLGGGGQQGWHLELDLVTPDPDYLALDEAGDNKDGTYLDDITNDWAFKLNTSYPSSFVDIYGRALSYHLFPGTTLDNFYAATGEDHAAGLLWSDIQKTTTFSSYESPLPLVVSTSRVNFTEQERSQTGSPPSPIPQSNTQFEFTPFTFGSFDPTLMAHIPVEFAGSYANNGTVTSCWEGVQNAGFVVGTSAALFNNLEVNTTVFNNITKAAEAIYGLFYLTNTSSSGLTSESETGEDDFTVAKWGNSFYNFTPSDSVAFESAQNSVLQLTDGSENLENIPLSPLLVKARGQDLILAVDGSA
ncbi:hypothetical protein RQP46_008744 [Phenoliferia psychrophenolica]